MSVYHEKEKKERMYFTLVLLQKYAFFKKKKGYTNFICVMFVTNSMFECEKTIVTLK